MSYVCMWDVVLGVVFNSWKGTLTIILYLQIICSLLIAYCNYRSKNLIASLPWYVPTDSEQRRNILDGHEECVQFETESTS